MQTRVLKASLDDKPILERLLELYQYDLSAIEGTDLNAYGLFGYEYLDLYWTEPGRHPFLIRVHNQLAGFVLVSQHTYLAADDDAMTIAEFFVMKKYRGQGVGEQVANYIFNLFPGQWEIRQLAENVAAQAFWRRVIARHTGGRFEQVYLQDDRWHGPVQVFKNTRQSTTVESARPRNLRVDCD